MFLNIKYLSVSKEFKSKGIVIGCRGIKVICNFLIVFLRVYGLEEWGILFFIVKNRE